MSEQEFTVAVIASRAWDPEADNVDVEVVFADGRRYAATFFTIENIRRLFAKNRASGECAGGLYLWASNMIVVESLTIKTMERTVADLISVGEFENAFERIERETDV